MNETFILPTHTHKTMKNATIKLDSIRVTLDYDDSPDISWLEDRVKNPSEFYDKQEWIDKYLPKDKKLLEDFYNNRWFMFGYTIEYTFEDEKGFTKQTTDSLWSIDSLSKDYWFKEITRLIKLTIARAKVQGIKVKPLSELIHVNDKIGIGYEFNNRIHMIDKSTKDFCKNNNISIKGFIERYDVLNEIEVKS